MKLTLFLTLLAFTTHAQTWHPLTFFAPVTSGDTVKTIMVSGSDSLRKVNATQPAQCDLYFDHTTKKMTSCTGIVFHYVKTLIYVYAYQSCTVNGKEVKKSRPRWYAWFVENPLQGSYIKGNKPVYADSIRVYGRNWLRCK